MEFAAQLFSEIPIAKSWKAGMALASGVSLTSKCSTESRPFLERLDLDSKRDLNQPLCLILFKKTAHSIWREVEKNL